MGVKSLLYKVFFFLFLAFYGVERAAQVPFDSRIVMTVMPIMRLMMLIRRTDHGLLIPFHVYIKRWPINLCIIRIPCNREMIEKL